MIVTGKTHQRAPQQTAHQAEEALEPLVFDKEALGDIWEHQGPEAFEATMRKLLVESGARITIPGEVETPSAVRDVLLYPFTREVTIGVSSTEKSFDLLIADYGKACVNLNLLQDKAKIEIP